MDLIHHTIPDRNVVAAIEGCDPKLKDEWVIVSCHLDHNGADGEHIYNGADDNGSGVVGMLEIAEAYTLAAAKGQRPKRSVMFIAFNSEERGLLGAYAFTERPLVPLDKIVAVLNMDMIGRNEEVPLGGGPRFRGLAVQIGRVEPERLESPGLQLHAVAGEDRRAGQCPLRPDAQAGPRQQRVEPAPPQRPLAVSPARSPRSVHSHRPAPRLSHARRPSGEDRVRQDGAHRPPGPPGELGPRPATGSAAGRAQARPRRDSAAQHSGIRAINCRWRDPLRLFRIDDRPSRLECGCV